MVLLWNYTKWTGVHGSFRYSRLFCYGITQSGPEYREALGILDGFVMELHIVDRGTGSLVILVNVHDALFSSLITLITHCHINHTLAH